MAEYDGPERRSIDLVKYGALWQKVEEMDKKVEKMETILDELLALANKGRGGLWFGMSIASAVSAVVGFLLSMFK